jgi:nicotinic acid mononucleotide adenylyltransferase
MKAIFVFGRMNPPTVGHKLLIDNMLKYARKKRATPFIVVTHSQNKKKNPLVVNEKIKYIKMMYPHVEVLHTTRAEPNPNFIIKKLRERNFDDITMMVGDDQVGSFRKFVDAPVETGGTRNPNANNITGVSATEVRKLALKGNFKGVREKMNTSISNTDIRNIIELVQTRMK